MATKKITGSSNIPPWGQQPVATKPSNEPGSNTTFGQYQLHERLSELESSPVYRAFNKELGREEALKFVATNVDADTSERYKHELALLSSLDIPGVITVYRCGKDVDEQGREWTYFSMPLVKGETLDKYFQKNNYSLKEKLELLKQTAGIIRDLHHEDIIHKDLKPANVMVSASGQARLLDLGIAGIIGDDEEEDTYHGTPAFSSPEQLESKELSKATDVYSFSTMLFYVLTGQHPFLDDINETFFAIKEKCRRGRISQIEDFIPELQGQFSELIAKSLSLEPRLRPSIDKIYEVLEKLTNPAPKLKVSLIIGEDCQAERAIVDRVIRNFKVYYGRGLELQTTYGFNDEAEVVILLMWNKALFLEDVLSENQNASRYCLFKNGKDPLIPETVNIRKSDLADEINDANFISLDFKDLAELERHLFRFLRRSIKTLHPDCRRIPQRSWEGAPYIGLKTFEYKHSPVFFGRTFAISRALDLLRLQRASESDLLLIHGSSGCGKSSLVRAGLLPILTEYTLYGNKSLWDYQIIEFNTKKSTWQEQLRQNLNEKLDAEIDESNDSHIADSEIEEWLKAAADMNGQPRKQFGMIFFFDQLESFFTNENESNQRQLFDEFLVRLSRVENIIVISTLRSDFLPSLDSLPKVKEVTKSQGLLQLFPPSEYELNEIIRYPAIAAGLSFEDDPETGNGLEQSLCREAINSPEGLPLLEFLLTELNDGVTEEGMITWEKYKSLGGIAGALSQRAESTLNELSVECQKALPLVILKLMSYTRERNIIRNWMPLDEAYDNILYRQVIDHFVANRLFTVSRLNESSVVSVSHESLIRSWPRIKELAQEHENFLVFKSNLELPLRTWEKSLPTEKKEHLLTGSLLREGSKLMAKFPDFFTRREKEFLQESMLDKGKRDVIRNRQRLKYAKTLSIISLLTVIITVVFILILLKQRERENKNNLIIKDLSTERDKLNSAIQSQKNQLSDLNNELKQLSQQKVLIDQRTKMSRTDEQISLLASRLRKGTASYVSSMKTLNNISSDLRGWEWGYLYLKSLPDYQPILGHREKIASIQLSSDEKYLITASWDDTAKIWDSVNGKLITTLAHKSKGVSDVEYAIFSEDTTKAITASSDGFIRIWNIDFTNPSPSAEIAFKVASKPIRYLCFTPDGKYLISCDDTGSIKFWDWQGSNFKTPVSTYSHLNGLRCSKVIFSKDSLKMISIGWTQTPKLWNYTGNGSLISTPDFSKKNTHKDIIRDACFISDNEIVTVSKDRSMITWNLKTGTKKRSHFHKNDVMAVTHLPSLNLIATASKDRSIVLVEPYANSSHKTIKVHTNTINSLTALRETPKLFAVSSDGTGSIHTISEDQSSTNHIQKDYVFKGLKAYSIASNSQEVFVLDENGSIHTIEPNGSMMEEPLKSNYPLTNHKVLSFKYVKDFNYFIIVLSNGVIIELNANNRIMRPLEILPHKAEISPDGTSTALLSTDNKLYLYKSISDSPDLQPLLAEQSFTNMCWLSPNKLLLVDSNHIIYEYSLASFQLDELFHSGHNKNIYNIQAQMTADGPACITSSSDNKVYVQYLNTMNRIEFRGSSRNDISNYSLSPDAKRLIAISKNDNTPYLWNAVNGEELFPLPSLFSPLVDCSFSPDGTFIVVTDQNDTLRIFFSTSSSIPLPQ